MEIVFFHRKRFSGGMSIESSIKPLINALAKNNVVKEYHVPYRTTWPWNLIKNIIYIRKHSTRTGVNHITGDIHYGILGLIGRKSVLTIHDDYAMKTVSHGIFEKWYRYLLWIYLPIKLSGASVCISPSTKECILKYYKSPKLKVITHHCFPVTYDGKKRLFNTDKPIILNVGTTPNKNLETTLKVLSDIPCKLVVLKPMTDNQKRIAREYGIDYVNPVDIPYDEGDTTISHSLYTFTTSS